MRKYFEQPDYRINATTFAASDLMYGRWEGVERMSLDRVREAWSFAATWVREAYPSGTWQDRVNLMESALTTHEKEDEEWREMYDEKLRDMSRWQVHDIDLQYAYNRLFKEHNELSTQLQELLEAAKWVVEESGDRAIRANPAKSPLARLRQVIQNIEKGK